MFQFFLRDLHALAKVEVSKICIRTLLHCSFGVGALSVVNWCIDSEVAMRLTPDSISGAPKRPDDSHATKPFKLAQTQFYVSQMRADLSDLVRAQHLYGI